MWLASLVTASAVALALAGCSGGNGSAASSDGTRTIPADVKAAAKSFHGTFTYWMGLTYPDSSNTLEESRIMQWGKDLGINVKVVEINQNETSQRVAAALQSHTMPDALSIGQSLMQILQTQGDLEPVTSLYAQLGKDHGGWLPAVERSANMPGFNGQQYGIPYGIQSNLLMYRTDLLKGGAPKTWKEFAKDAAAAASPPKTYGLGFTLSNVLDGNNQTSILQSWGGRIANDAGTQCTLDSAPTKSYLEWVSGLYSDHVIPPDATTWDGSGDNNSYLAGKAAAILNSGSVYLSAKTTNPDLVSNTAISEWPAGPQSSITPINPFFRAVPKGTGSKVLAQDLITYLNDDAYASSFYNQSVYGPVLKSQTKAEVFSSSPVHKVLLKLATNGAQPNGPDKATVAFSELQNSFVIPHMIQRVVTDHVSVDKAVSDAQAACQQIYDKNK